MFPSHDQDGMDKPKTELAFRVPASKITKKNMYDDVDEELTGLDTTIDWKNTDDNSYDGEKLLLLVHDESGKWIKPNNILNNWRVTKTCLRLGSKIIGKCMMGSTSNALDKGGDNFKKLYEDSNVLNRNDEELSLYMNLNYKHAIEIAEEEAINTMFEENHYVDIRKRLDYDIMVTGMAVAKHECFPVTISPQ